jgi:hypothetical protein
MTPSTSAVYSRFFFCIVFCSAMFYWIDVESWDKKMDTGFIDAFSSSHLNQSIPYRYIFMYRFNLYDNPSLMEGEEKKYFKEFYDNVGRTVNIFNSTFKGKASIVFLNNTKCRDFVEKVIPQLLMHFDLEGGRYQSDICKIAELYRNGGYYFDVDLQTVSALFVTQKVSFVCLQSEESGLFPLSFIASAPKNKILKRTLENMVYDYRISGISSDDFPPIGSHTMTMAFQSLSYNEKGECLILAKLSSSVIEMTNCFRLNNCYYVVSNSSGTIVFKHGVCGNNTSISMN